MTNPYIYKNWRQKNREAAGRSRNAALNDVYKKFGLPKNMANKEIGRRIKFHNWVVGEIVTGSHNNGSNSQIIKAHKNEINTFTKFLNNDTLLTESKRKSLITLAIQLDDKSVIALRNPVVITYLMKVQYLVTAFTEFYNPYKLFTKQLKALGKYREDAAMVSVLKKRINLMKKIRKWEGYPFLSNNLYNDLHNRGILDGEGDALVHFDELKEIMDTLFPLPPHTNSTRKTAATRIQKTARRVITRKKAATTIQKTVRGMINRKKVGRKKSPQ
jgi:hypothetical protein